MLSEIRNVTFTFTTCVVHCILTIPRTRRDLLFGDAILKYVLDIILT